MKDFMIYESLKDRLRWSKKKLSFNIELRDENITKGNIVEAECIKLRIEKIKHNVECYNNLIETFDKIKSLHLTEEEIECVRNNYT